MPVTTKPQILVLPDLSGDHSADYEQFCSQFSIINYKLTTREQFIEDLQPGHLLGNIVGIFSDWTAFSKIGHMNADLIKHLPNSLKITVVPSTGYESFDVEALSARGITMCNTPAISSSAVADAALLLTLSVFRYMSAFEKAVRTTGNVIESRAAVGNMDKKRGSLVFDKEERFVFGSRVSKLQLHVESPYGKRVGIAGFGKIGQQIACRLSALGMKIHYFKRSRLSEDEENSLSYPVHYHGSFDSLCQVSDLLLLALPGDRSTEHILNQTTIRLLPYGAKVVNVGRGSLINENHLVEALSDGHISSVGLDVYENEQSINPELLRRDDVTLTPHVGACTEDVYVKAYNNCMKNISQYFTTGKAVSSVNSSLHTETIK